MIVGALTTLNTHLMTGAGVQAAVRGHGAAALPHAAAAGRGEPGGAAQRGGHPADRGAGGRHGQAQAGGRILQTGAHRRQVTRDTDVVVSWLLLELQTKHRQSFHNPRRPPS